MEIKNYVKQKESIFGEDDDEILLNPICYINQFETININTNKITNNFTTQKSIEDQNNKNNISINSTLNTNAALDESSQNINNNCSFFSFSQNQHKEHKKELTQQSIEILTEFISKEKEIINTNNINNSLKVLKIKDLKNNCGSAASRPSSSRVIPQILTIGRFPRDAQALLGSATAPT